MRFLKEQLHPPGPSRGGSSPSACLSLAIESDVSFHLSALQFWKMGQSGRREGLYLDARSPNRLGGSEEAGGVVRRKFREEENRKHVHSPSRGERPWDTSRPPLPGCNCSFRDTRGIRLSPGD